ncbi:MAG TPA: hypothetical protein VK478_14990 [Gemmatimonadaceae bacterium]|nr:hypothetical protein [Gemmatimonadaceae bacterium]
MSRAKVFVASVSLWTLAACVPEKNVESAINTTDTLVATERAARTSTTIVAASSTATDTGVKSVSGAVPRVPADQKVGMRLVDTVETDHYYASRVEVTFAGRVDTIPGVLTFDMPVVASDRALHGPNIDMEEHYVGIYSYDPRTRVLSNMPLPDDASGWASEVKLSPDASHIAYVGGDSTGDRGIVRSWPAAAVVFTTMSAPQAPSDYSYNQVWWVSSDSVEFAWHIDLGRETKPAVPRFPFIAIYASLTARRFKADTLEKPPNFQAAAQR